MCRGGRGPDELDLAGRARRRADHVATRSRSVPRIFEAWQLAPWSATALRAVRHRAGLGHPAAGLLWLTQARVLVRRGVLGGDPRRFGRGHASVGGQVRAGQPSGHRWILASHQRHALEDWGGVWSDHARGTCSVRQHKHDHRLVAGRSQVVRADSRKSRMRQDDDCQGGRSCVVVGCIQCCRGGHIQRDMWRRNGGASVRGLGTADGGARPRPASGHHD
mmetsp:Transcript_120115/g.383424  ORF Transcript_120115/g.383424 Transcript_120115/m.383424 type:complete len:220 (-) Transcript_120115:600-1259(-)